MGNWNPGKKLPDKFFCEWTGRLKLGVMNVDLGIWSKLTKIVVVLLLIAGLLLVAVWYLPLIRQNERMRAEILKLDAQLQVEQEKSRTLQAEIEALRNDPKTVERLTREKLGYAKPDETIIRFEPPATNNLSKP
jgi:cell division protein FtsB